MKKQFVVYEHRKKDNNELFYIGIGSYKYRPYEKRRRNNYWNNIVNKHGLTVNIIYKVDTWQQACIIETMLISKYGRIDKGTGILCNMTDGGDGSYGFKQSKEQIENRVKHFRGKKQSQELINKRAKKLKEVWDNPDMRKKHSERVKLMFKNNPEIVKKISNAHKGKTYSPETIERMRQSALNKKMPENFSETMSLVSTGSKNGNSKITEKDVIWIRKNYIPRHKIYGRKPLCEKYDIKLVTIDKIINRSLWKHI